MPQIADQILHRSELTLCANSRHMQCSKKMCTGCNDLLDHRPPAALSSSPPVIHAAARPDGRATCRLIKLLLAEFVLAGLGEAPGSAWGREVLGMPNTTFAWC